MDRLSRNGSIAPESPTLVIGSTHDPEEKLFLEALGPLWENYPRLKVYLVPRHPERFNEVARLIEARGWPYARSSTGQEARLVLVDEMGKLKVPLSKSRSLRRRRQLDPKSGRS